MHRPLAESVVASTTIDMFDEKHRLRQGTFNLQLWPKVEAEISQQTNTPGLHLKDNSLQEINKLLQKIDKFEKSQNYV